MNICTTKKTLNKTDSYLSRPTTFLTVCTRNSLLLCTHLIARVAEDAGLVSWFGLFCTKPNNLT